MLRVVLAVALALHGVIHLIGFVVTTPRWVSSTLQRARETPGRGEAPAGRRCKTTTASWGDRMALRPHLRQVNFVT